MTAAFVKGHRSRRIAAIIAGVAAVIGVLTLFRRSTHDELDVRSSGELRAAGGAGPHRTVASATSEAASHPIETVASAPSDAPVAATAENEIAGALHIHVIWSDDRRPARNVRVRCRFLGAVDALDADFSVESDDAGEITIERMRTGKFNLRAVLGGEVEGQLKSGTTTETTLEIPAGFLVEGVVVDANGKPSGDAEIYLMSPADLLHAQRVGRSAPDGTFRIRGVNVGQATFLGARRRGAAPSKCISIVGRDAEAMRRLRLQLGPQGADLDGRVVDAEGAAISGARVFVGFANLRQVILGDGTAASAPVAVECTTDPAGRFHVEGLDIGDCPIVVQARGFARSRVNVVLQPDAPNVVEIHATLGAICVGRVVDLDGRPMTSTIAFHATDSSGEPNVKSQSDGRFRMEGLPAGAATLVAEATESGARAEKNVVLDAGRTVEVEIKIGGGLALKGIVVDETDRPLSGVYVQIRGERTATSDNRTRRTDVEGKFAFPTCADDAYSIVVRRPGESSSIIAMERGVHPGGAELRIKVARERLGAAVIRGRVAAPDGTPLHGVDVQCWCEGESSAISGLTRPETGAFEMSNLMPGAYHVIIRAVGYAEVRTDEHVLADGDVWDLGLLRMVEGVDVVVALTRPTGNVKPIDLRIYATASGTRVRSLTIDGDEAAVSGLPAGDYEYLVSGPNICETRGAFTLRSRERARVEIAPEAASSLEISFAVGSGGNPKHIELSFSEAGGHIISPASFVPPLSGELAVAFPLPKGTWTIVATTNDGRRGSATTNVSGGSDSIPVRIELR